MDQQQRPLVQNAANEKQLKTAEVRGRLARDRELNEMRAILATKEGRRWVWRLMGRCKVFSSVYEQSARIHYNSGQQDIGHYIMAEVMEADPDKFILMGQEHQQEMKQQGV
jgi:hypothetical protein